MTAVPLRGALAGIAAVLAAVALIVLLAGAPGWAAAVVLAAAVAAAVARLATEVPLRRRPARAVRITLGSAEAAWVERAATAAALLDRVAARSRSGPLGGITGDAARASAAAMRELRLVAAEISELDLRLRELPAAALRFEAARLRAEHAAAAGPGAPSHVTTSLAAAEERLAARDRLAAARAAALDELRACTAGLEEAAARMAQLAAPGPGGASARVAALVEQVTALQAGIAETQRITDAALGSAPVTGRLGEASRRPAPAPTDETPVQGER